MSKSVLFTPDLTKTQRKEAFLLREQLRYQKNVMNKKNLKVSIGRIAEIEQEASENQNATQGAAVFEDVSEGATAMAGHPTSRD